MGPSDDSFFILVFFAAVPQMATGKNQWRLEVILSVWCPVFMIHAFYSRCHVTAVVGVCLSDSDSHLFSQRTC